MFEGLQQQILALVPEYGDVGVLIAMFLESSIIPIPSEAVLITAGALGIPALNIAIFGAIGSTLGGIIGYYIGKKGGRPFVDKYGHFFFLTPERVVKVEQKVEKYGSPIILVARLVPLVPFKVFSIAAGMLKLDLPQFLFFTLIGTFFRAYLLAVIGLQLIALATEYFVIILLAIVLIAIAGYYYSEKIKKNGKES